MKNLFMLYTILICILLGCSENNSVEKTTVQLAPDELIFSSTSETKIARIITTEEDFDVSVDDSGKNWCSVEVEGKVLKVTVLSNSFAVDRKTTVSVKMGNEIAFLPILQTKIGLSETSTTIPLGGNSYLTAGEGGRVTDQGLVDWTDAQTVFSSFFRVNQTGTLRLFLDYETDVEGNEIEVDCLRKSFRVVLPKQEEPVFVGEVQCEQAGYVRVDFRGVKKSGEAYARLRSLCVEGSASENMNFVGDFSFYWGRRGPSVHMNYAMPENVQAEWFYNEVTVPEGEDVIGSYFMSNGFGEGYFGIQVNSERERRVLFSVWSPFETDDPNAIPEEHKIKLTKKGEGVQIGEFGNEGSGGQSFLRFNWKAGNTYRFLTRIRPHENGYSEYTSYFFAPEMGKWQLIAQFLRPGTTTYYTRAHSFLENFLTEQGDKGRKAFYTNQWIRTVDGQWMELTSGRFSVDETGRKSARMDYKGGVESAGFFLENGGFLNDYTTPGAAFERTPSGKQPEINWSELE